MYKKIVVPLDGSRLAEVALPYAEELAGKMGSEMVLLSVIESEEAHEYEKHNKYAKKIVEATKQHAGKYLGESGRKVIKVGAATRVGNPAEGIINYVSRGTSTLIVMATHGRSGIGRWAIGSVADKVVRNTTKQPLMLVRAKGARSDLREKRILKKALVPLDGSTRSEAVIPYIRDITSRLKMELNFLQVVPQNNHNYTDVESYLQNVCRKFENTGITANYYVREGATADEIIDLADEITVDVVAMSTHGKSAVNLWPLGSIAQKVLFGGNTPLLLVRA